MNRLNETGLIRLLSNLSSSIKSALSKKADSSHTHNQNDINGLTSTLAGKSDTGHTHNIADVTSLQSTLNNKADASHNHDSSYDTKGSADTALNTAKSYTDTKTSGLASTTNVDNKISTHNTSTSAHSDIRTLITDLTTKLNNFLDVDDTTVDQLSEVLTLIENNKGTLESLTSSKVNVSDIVDNLTTSNASKVLSAKQGVAIKELIDALQIAVDEKASASDLSNYYTKTEINNLEFITADAIDAEATRVDNELAKKVDKVDGKGLSTNDLTNDLKANYDAAYTHSQEAHAPANAQANIIESVKVNGTALTITNKAVDITVPTDNTELTNGAGYLVANDIANKADKATTLAGYGISDAYTSAQTDTAIANAIGQFEECTESDINALFA